MPGTKKDSSGAVAPPVAPVQAAPVATHTQGPWRIVKGRTLLHIVGEGPVCSISVSANHVHEDQPGDKSRYVERQEANARLIAAAPDLYEALQLAVIRDETLKHNAMVMAALAKASQTSQLDTK